MTAPTLAAAPALPRRLLPVLFIGVFMAALDTAIIGPAIPALREAFGVDNRRVGLVMIVFILCSLSSTALMANLSDRHGRRPVFLGSVTLFALGSLLIAASPRFWMLLVGRAIQGAGGGGIIPTASAVIGDQLPPDKRGRALGLIGATYGMAFVLGPPLAAALLVVASWHWIFLINLPIAAAVLWLGHQALPRRRVQPAANAPLDLAGIVLVFALLSSLVLGITRVADGLSGLQLWPAFLGAALLLTPLLIAVERRAAMPMIPPTLFGRRRLVITYGLTLGSGFGMGGVSFLTSIAQLADGVSARNAGFALLPLVLCSMVGSAGSGRMLNRAGPRRQILAGFALLALGYAATSQTGWGLAGFLLASMPVGLGVGILVGGALRTIAIDEAPQALRASAQGLINIGISIGTLLAAAAIGAVADFGGGGAPGFGRAYVGVALVMAAMFALALALREPAVP
ncbi:MAG: MFS transporter [Burkholderiales bacterium]|nr:MFS transporter [Burkholderiales bacterium]MDE1928177.1 MFS transporter [Burkholderiales bacterium]MDE2160365.1 MFS transporter [Burkholderiales bacterium]MDE2501639.1 MFS transporter [Burkholderiales bacterium]